MSDWNWKAILLFLGNLGGGLALALTAHDPAAQSAGYAMIYGALTQMAPAPQQPR